MTSVDSNFNFLCGRPHGAGPPSTCVHMGLTLPLRVDVINGCPLNFKETNHNESISSELFILVIAGHCKYALAYILWQKQRGNPTGIPKLNQGDTSTPAPMEYTGIKYRGDKPFLSRIA